MFSMIGWLWLAAGIVYWFACMAELGWTTAKGWNPREAIEENTWRYRILWALPICVVFAPLLWLMYFGMVIFEIINRLRETPNE